MKKIKTRTTSIVPGQRVGATTKAHKQDINPQVMGCMRLQVEDDKTVDGTTGNGAATGLPKAESAVRTDRRNLEEACRRG
jgi:hypothetical protein